MGHVTLLGGRDGYRPAVPIILKGLAWVRKTPERTAGGQIRPAVPPEEKEEEDAAGQFFSLKVTLAAVWPSLVAMMTLAMRFSPSVVPASTMVLLPSVS